MKFKIHKKYYSIGSISVCGRIAQSPEHSKESWKDVDCKVCLKMKNKMEDTH